MVVKVYVSGISGNKEVKKRQQRVLMILDSKNIQYDIIDITEPGNEADKDFMQNNSKSNGGTVSDPNPRSPLPPQLFNDEEYCGDYDQFDMANEVDTLEQFLKLEVPPEEPASEDSVKIQNGDASKQSKENSQDRDTEAEKPAENGKEKSTSREATPAERTESKEASPEKNNEDSSPEKAKESSPVRETSIEKEKSEESTNNPKESSPDKESVNENGTVSSREQSEEKESVIESKKDPSELLIESEKIVSAE